ncbi:type IV pilus biogenesis/stability protein PilW [Stenotrophomonas aracearum]|jgi:type IV pilus assembly protein PilF|uniref:Type IV pilus biogenesis/stability protein PilW n=1 Tax=Stenotrophomonas aracearum TaxID=3003272 RepID=A0ABY9YH96_9GAMM|nr:type IV pilus biogenesis/stability protein PilW [Stenotrophomonas sp. A5588]WNH50233.1 type IV pilus biogenesis/stability protein PilW [Stenotrophomonas sp. A5588]
MPLPDLRLPAVVFVALAFAGCGSKGVKPISAPLGIAPEYVARDSADTRRRFNYQDQLTLAAEAFRAGQPDVAEKRARSALKLDPGQPDAYILLAALANQRGAVAEAGPLFQKAAELAPQSGDVLNNYGAWLCGQGRAAEALPLFDRAVVAPGYRTPAAALANAGGCALDAGQPERAVRDLRKALVLEPGNAYALESMARNEYAQSRYFEARAFVQRRLAAAPATRSVLQLASQIEAQLGDTVASGRYLQRIRDEFPQDAAPNSRG